ncbi:hypothetical protein ACS0TY_002287 [Phlomoides rotata]
MNFKRSAQTVHKYFHNVLRVVLALHDTQLVTPTPVDEDCTHPRWKYFKGCLGALDGTLIDVTIPEADKVRYRTRKGTILVNVLATCSAADTHVLRDALTPEKCFKVPNGHFYLCDKGYPNEEGFLTPYKMVRYHLSEWGNGPSIPQNYKEYF